MISTESIQSGIKRLAQAMEQSADELNTADGLLGDGDLGVTMIRGFRQILADLETLPEDIGMAFFQCAKAFTKSSGSSYGTLLATGMMAIAKVKKGQTIMIVEAMKTMNHVPSTENGTVSKIFVKDGEPVEFGQPLISVK